MADERIKARDFADRLKLALVAHDPGTWVKRVFPNWVNPPAANPEGEEVEYLDEVTDDDLQGGSEWRFQERISPEEAEKILAEMTANPKGKFGMDELEQEGWQ